MIYFLSDQHGGERLGDLEKYLNTAGEDDLLIILGDMGIRFRDTEENRAFDELMLSAKKKIAFIDGNHENFDYLESFPMGERYGAPVRILNENLVWLLRGYVYKIEDKTFFTFGGCRSGAKWKELGLWWPQDAPTEEELKRAYENLDKCSRRVDYVLTHKYEEGKGTGTEDLFKLCKFIEENVEYKHWYAGHWHTNKTVDEKHTLIYDVLTPIK